MFPLKIKWSFVNIGVVGVIIYHEIAKFKKALVFFKSSLF